MTVWECARVGIRSRERSNLKTTEKYKVDEIM